MDKKQAISEFKRNTVNRQNYNLELIKLLERLDLFSDSGVTSVNGKTGSVTLSKSDIGLSNVDNTSDSNKPISNATQSALSDKANQSDLQSHSNDVSNPHEVTKSQVGLGNVDNTSDANKPISDATQSALNSKADQSDLQSHSDNTSNPHNVTASQVGLGNVDNTSDADKPVSNATSDLIDSRLSSSQRTAINALTLIDEEATLEEVAVAINNIIQALQA